jgi:hypothetical protein
MEKDKYMKTDPWNERRIISAEERAHAALRKVNMEKEL